jgi:hypothetical protein
MAIARTIRAPVAAVVAGILAVVALAVTVGAPDVTGAPPKIIWVSPRAFVAGQNIAGGTLTLTSPSGDEQHVTTSTAGDLQWVDLPLQLPNSARIKRVITCYKVDAPTSFISQVRLSTSTVPPTATVMYDDPTDLTSTAGACRYGMTVSGIPVNGEFTLSLRLDFGSTNEAIDLGAIGIVYQ